MKFPKKKNRSLEFPGLFELEEQGIIGTQWERQATVVIVTGICLQVLNDIGKQVGSFHSTSWSVVLQRGEMDVEVIVRRLIVEINAQFARRDAVLPLNGILWT